jgi:polyisoprenoid-binding protein YceI
MKATTLAIIFGSTFALTKTVEASTWSIDASHANAQFSVKHMMVSNVRGAFSNITGTLELNDKDITKSQVNVEIDASTIDTRNEKRDAHLKAADFFNVAKYPKLTFKSTKVKRIGKGKLKVTGDLTIRGVTRSVILEVEGPTPEITSPWGQKVRGVHATTTINRKDWGLTWNKALEAGGLMVGEDVKITLDVELIKSDNKAS